jgi:hypothetical protein
MNWAKYFEMMVDWKLLPAYKAEPRIDSFVGFFLPEFMSEFLNEKIIGIVPELPIRLGTVKPKHEGTSYADRSYKVDFYLLGEGGINYLIEFKTDTGSRRDKQDTYLEEAKDIGMKSLVKGILQIASVSSYKKKYNHLLNKLKSIGILNNENTYSGKSDKIQIIYIQPKRTEDGHQCVDFQWISKWLNKKYKDGEFEAEFSRALIKWSID